METKSLIQKTIYNWVAENFGESEAEDPSWNIEALAEELDKHSHEIWEAVELAHIKEDLKTCASNYEIEVEDKDLDWLAEKWLFSGQYVEPDWHTMAEFIEGELC